MTWPRITASMLSAGTPVRSSAARMAAAPSAVEESGAKAPLNFANGARAPPRRTGVVSSVMGILPSQERGDAGDVPADDQRLYGLGALIGVQRLDVGEVPG